MIPESLITTIKSKRSGYKAHWVYNEQGLPTLIVARYDTTDKLGQPDKAYHQWSFQACRWVEGVPDTPLPLFGLDSLAWTSPLNALFITEGEKCTSVIHSLCLPCITNALGAENFGRANFSILQRYDTFIVLRDNDTPGVKFTRSVAGHLKKMSPDCKVHVCNFDDIGPKGDVVDWIQSYPLKNIPWDGFTPILEPYRETVRDSLLTEIEKRKVLVEHCPHVAFKSEQTLFVGEPEPIEQRLAPAASFPLDVLTTPFKEYAQIRAQRSCLPPDFTATSLIGFSAGLIGRSFRLEMRPGHDWYEDANLWILLIGNPSSGKSPTMNAISSFLIDPVDDLHRMEFEKALQKFKNHEPKKGQEKPETPLRVRICTDDATIPALKDLMARTKRGIILRNDEIKGTFRKLEKDGCEGDRAFLLSSWSGSNRYYEDRITRGANLEVRPTLTWIGGTQPDSIREYLTQATSASGGDGLIQRFQAVSYPDPPGNFEDHDIQNPPELIEKLKSMALSLNRLCGENERYTLRFDQEAQAHFVTWYTNLENEKRTESNAYWQGHLGKLTKLVAALCIQLHLFDQIDLYRCEKAENVPPIPISILLRALELVDYFVSHAKRTYSSIEHPVVTTAKQILVRITLRKLKNRFKASDIYQNSNGAMKSSQLVHEALEFLRERNYVFPEKTPSSGGGMMTVWIIHPSLLK